MKLKEYIKLADKKIIPENIRPYRLGELDVKRAGVQSIYIENLVTQGSFTIIVESSKVRKNTISPILFSALCNPAFSAPKHLENSSGTSVKCAVYIALEVRRQYMRQINLLAKNKSFEDETFLFDFDRLSELQNDGLALFKSAMKQYAVKVVMFDTESIGSDGMQNLKMMREILRYCSKNEISVVLFLRNRKTLQHFHSLDHLIHVWEAPQNKLHYIIEIINNIGESPVKPFEIWFDGTSWKSETVNETVLDKIPDREKQYDEPGIEPETEAFIDNISPNSNIFKDC